MRVTDLSNIRLGRDTFYISDTYWISNSNILRMHILTLEPVSSIKTDLKKSQRKYLDFIVSGQSLSAVFNVRKHDLVGVFGWTENNAYEHKQLDQFAGVLSPDLQTGRIPFYVCSECGDIGCGAITGIIELTETTVIWKAFGFETDYSEPELETYKHIGPFVFDRHSYLDMLKKVRDGNML